MDKQAILDKVKELQQQGKRFGGPIGPLPLEPSEPSEPKAVPAPKR